MAVQLNALIREAESGNAATPLLIAHGLFGSARNFSSLSRKIAQGRRTILVDMRNHGESPWDADCSYPAMADDLAATVRAEAGGTAVVLGHSMGGKAAMALALLHPEHVAALVVADIAPVAYRHSHAGYISAMEKVDLAAMTRRADADPTLAEAIPEAPLRAFLLQNLVFEDGAARWRINLAGLAEGMPDLLDWPESLAGRTYDGPTLFLHGGASDYVAPPTHGAVRSQFPAAEIDALPGAGHWLHAEQPEAFAARIGGWLAARS